MTFATSLLLSAVSAVFALSAQPVFGQSTETLAGPATRTAVVPKLIKFSGILLDGRGYPVKFPVDATFSLYAASTQTDENDIWQEIQHIAPDENGSYTVFLGAVHGLPAEAFTSVTAQYLGVKVEGEPELARTLLVSVPYALESGDAQTLGGLPASAFALASPKAVVKTVNEPVAMSSLPRPDATPAPLAVTTTGGVANYIPKFSAASAIVTSEIFDAGTGVTIGGTTPASGIKLDIYGPMAVRGKTELLQAGTATSTVAYPSQDLQLFANAYNSSTKLSAAPYFVLRSEPSGNNTASPSATFNFLYNGNGGTPAETGLYFNPNGTIHFSSAQTFPINSATGTVKSVALTAPSSDFTVTGSPITSSGTLALNWKTPPSIDALANSIVKRDPDGQIFGANVIASNGLFSSGNAAISEALTVGGLSYLRGAVAIGTKTAPQAELQLNYNDTANADSLLLGNTTTKGLRLRNNGAFSVAGVSGFGTLDLESIGDPLCVNCTTKQTTSFGGYVGMGTMFPQANFNMNFGGTANKDYMLLGNLTTKGLQFRDNGVGVDIESIGVPLYVNYFPQTTYLNPNGAMVVVNDNRAYTASNSNYALQVGTVVYQVGQIPFRNSAHFEDDVVIGGTLSVTGSKNFRIDHPLDPRNKYLNHAAIESSEILNQYSGNVTTDGSGLATVRLPDWFAAENIDFRYQLTVIGGRFAQAIVSKEIEKNQFTISTNATNVKVSWQVTARRNDLYIQEHPLIVEEEKPESERGHYIRPEIYGEAAYEPAHVPVHAPLATEQAGKMPIGARP